MDARHERGLVIAALCKLGQREGAWLVPSQTGNERIYRVNPEAKTCTCPDHQEAGHKCKHIWAVEITMQRELFPDGTVVETKQMVFTERKTYKQNWPAYNQAQMQEKSRFQALLYDLCRGIEQPKLERPKGGRPRTPMADQVFASAFKVYSTVSSRRFACDLEDAFKNGFLYRLMHAVSICAYLEEKDMTPVLQRLIVQSSLPLRQVETDFATDSSGFSTSRFVRWYDEKYGCTRSGKEWVKAHICTGVKTNIVTHVVIADKDANDSPQFDPLMRQTAQNFPVRNVSADKAYLSHYNLELVEHLGGTPRAVQEQQHGAPGRRMGPDVAVLQRSPG
jgi:Transposase DDE domain/SWIM zinc finger